MRKRLSVLSVASTLAILAFSQTATAQSNWAYGSSALAPTIYSKNIWNNATFPVVGTPPSTALITTVYYRWSYNYPRPSGFQVLLCHSANMTCFDVTSMASGSVNFSGYGAAANSSIRLYSKVSGTGTMMPLHGGSSSVTVNYTY